MTNRTKITTALALALGLAATPSLAQSLYSDSASYNRDGTLNVWGAHIDPVSPRGGVLGGVGNVVGGTVGAVGGIVGGTVGAAGTIVGGTVGAADDIVTGSIGGPRNGYTDYSARAGNAEQLDRPVPQYGRVSGGPLR
ncbi:hypothetical protein [Methylobacterium organophilum]|uniref:Uncharacterized protein n=1 Tax=Methylobacterium organophilum TaxID=410 RepID=A0ABQ4TDM8_METOR|nr:hypothetical protein [Methylobacterium organophilum]GJE28804.1 hypothetical protein LKMONMHP_3678 [Methylobacterium organophilum]